MDDNKDMVNDGEGVQSLGGREILSSMRYGICICVAVVVMLMVAVGVGMLMAAMGVAVLVIVDGVSCIGTMEVDCTGVVDTLM